ncbi:ABC transporter ATP-binding protein [Treponema sp.]|uniref:ABC transporter ATP-binding protein n=1 Tax=Treponema sp. TaxID=166 RepID=UPI002A81C1E6|nr:ABC transporter ATP-binding protein [Treponema sp.]MCI6443300.1 ABC transporter ATP-binding protein [Spirochaetia bacterium]MDY4132280.1 ABC transporter ATP-binding protein [Treponema sp.]
MSDEYILSLKNIEKTYESSGENLTIIKDLSLDLERGKKCVIVGKSGSGKSTLLNMIGGLDAATSGTILVNGQDVSKMNEKQINEFRKKVLGLVFQFHYLLKDFTAVENIFLPAYMAGVPKKEAFERANDLLEEVGLADRKDHLPSQLSGGERQRVAVARSLVNDPELILADEPTGNLDPENAILIGDMLFRLSEKHGKTLVLVTHDMNLATKGDVRYSIEGGALVEKV